MISYVSLWAFLANSYCYQSPFSFLIIKCNRILTMDSHLHIRRRIFLCWHIWEFPQALLVWTWNLSSEILIRVGVHHFSRDLPCVPKQVMEKPRRRPSLAQTAMAGAHTTLLKYISHYCYIDFQNLSFQSGSAPIWCDWGAGVHSCGPSQRSKCRRSCRSG